MSWDGARGIWMGIYGEWLHPALRYEMAWVCAENEHRNDGGFQETDTSCHAARRGMSSNRRYLLTSCYPLGKA
jgi:hypothetical protein